jgi:hypothetical protein
LCTIPIESMCPREVCTVCGTPRRRIVGDAEYVRNDSDRVPARLAHSNGTRVAEGVHQHKQTDGSNTSVTRVAPTLGWTCCGCGDGCTPPGRTERFTPATDTSPATVEMVATLGMCADSSHFRPGVVLDPFGGSGTVGAVATGHGRDAILVDLDERNAELARDRIGMFCTVETLEHT